MTHVMGAMPTICRIVQYTLSENDAEAINQRRSDENITANLAEAGQPYPAIVVRTFGASAANLQVLLDGPDTHWVTSRCEDTSPISGAGRRLQARGGAWIWPPRG